MIHKIMYLSCSIGCWLLYEGREDWPRNSELFGIKGICSWLLKVSSTLRQEQIPLIPNNEAPSSRWLALALLPLVNIPINRSFSESLLVPDYCLFLLKIKILTRFRNEKLFVKVGVTVNLSPCQPKIKRRSQLRLHSLLNTFD